MGTPCNLVIKKNNEVILEKFFHWDGYQSWAGVKIVEFILRHSTEEIEEMVKSHFEFISLEEYNKIYEEYFVTINEELGWCVSKPGKNFSDDYPMMNERIDVDDFLKCIEIENKKKYTYCNDNVKTHYEYIIDLDNSTFTFPDISDDENKDKEIKTLPFAEVEALISRWKM